RRENSDDRVIHSVQCHGPAKSLPPLAETISPKTIADDNDPRSAVHVFPRRELAAQCQLHPERLEKSPGDLLAVKMLGRSWTCQIVVLLCECRHALEGVSVALPIEKVGVGEIGCVLKGLVVQQGQNQAIWLFVG